MHNRYLNPTVIHSLALFLAMSSSPLVAQISTADATGITRELCLQAESISITPEQIGEPVSAVLVEAVSWEAANENGVPAHCLIKGRMDPVDTSDTARPINFGVAIPALWNGRSIQMGGGGMNGMLPGLTGRGPRSDLANGYSTYGSDSGHAFNDEQWTLNDEAIRNLGYLQLKKTHDAAMLLIKAVSGTAPRFNYFVGSSQGGREGLTVVQRYPRDYDGVLSSVPIVGFSSLMLAPTLIRIEEKPAARWVPASKGTAILTEIMRQCDALDGSTDAVINNYQDCRAIFNVNDSSGPLAPWQALQCPGNTDPDPSAATASACLTSGQIQTLHYIFSDYSPDLTLANGRTHFGMWAPTTAIAGGMPGFGNMAPPGALLMAQRYAGQEGAADDAAIFATLGSNGVTGFMMQNLSANPLDFDPAVHGKRLQQLSSWLDSTQTDLGAFAARGGKLIVTIGTDDTIAPSGEQLNYYQAVLDTMGRSTVDDFARFYVLPQTGHGLTGRSATINGAGETVEPVEIPSQADRFALLRDWVEAGRAPGHAITVSGMSGSRPMCSYPQYPHFKGGDPALASSYSCTAPALAD